jgi:hypothetical protein
MVIKGGCHCGNLHYELLWPQSLGDIAVRNCSCTFCQKHGDAELEVGIDDTTMVSKYRFGTKTADFYVCSVCGVVPFIACEIDGQQYAVVNTRTFKDLAGKSLISSKSSFDGEETGDRLSRRQRNWIPRVRITEAR